MFAVRFISEGCIIPISDAKKGLVPGINFF